MAAAEADAVDDVINAKETEVEDDVTTSRETEVRNTSGFVDNWQHERTLVESLRYSLKENILCDVTFIVGEDRTRIQAHKLILSLRSCVFHAMLTGELKEQDDIVIPDTEAEIFHLFLEFLYTDQTDFKADNVIRLLYLARKYDVIHLEKRCLNYLQTEMTTEDACVVLEESHIYKQDDFKKTCLKYIWENGEGVLNSQSFTDLCRGCFRKIIEPDDLKATEETVFQSCMKWSEAECRRQKKEITAENQREVLGKELYLIRFPLLDSEYFQNKVLPKDILNESEQLEIMRSYVYPDVDVSLFSKSRRVGTKKKLIKIDRFENICFQQIDDFLSWYSDTITFCLNTNASLKGFSILTLQRKSKQQTKGFVFSNSLSESEKSISIKASVCEVSTDVIVPGSSVDKQIDQSVFDVDFPSPLDIKKDTQYKLMVETKGGVRCLTVNREGEIREGFLKCTLSDSEECSHDRYYSNTNFISRLKFLV